MKYADRAVHVGQSLAVQAVLWLQKWVHRSWAVHRRSLLRVGGVILLTAYAVYFCLAMVHNFGDEGSVRLLWVTCVVIFFVAMKRLKRRYREQLNTLTEKCLQGYINVDSDKLSWFIVIALYVVVLTVVLVDILSSSEHMYNLISGGGLIAFLMIFFVFSHDPSKVRWRTIVWGLALQLLFALLIVRSRFGNVAFRWLGTRVANFLGNVDPGTRFVFGDHYIDHPIAFKILPVIVFFSIVIAILYHYGIMQKMINVVASVMEFTMATTPAESFNAAGNIFIGLGVSLLMIRPLVKTMTRSELHAVLTSGMATIAGSVMAAFMLFGVSASHLLSASVMSAPAALAIAKLFYPECEKSFTRLKDVRIEEQKDRSSIMEVTMSSIRQAVKLVANIVVNIVAFTAILIFINAILLWLGHRVGMANLTFESICSYVLYPLMALLGIDLADCLKVGELVGVKMFLSTFVAYTRLADLINNRRALETHVAANGTFIHDGVDIILREVNVTLVNGVIQERSEVIATYAMCGFASLTAVGVALGVIRAIAPTRMKDASAVAMRAMIAGNGANFLTACIAGLLYRPEV
ncbi:Solute carrier family 28 member 3 [Lamellibrachia satsuma]|nr:Solute carrier family 28 member 3 [Lamellibrachia satsuma]